MRADRPCSTRAQTRPAARCTAPAPTHRTAPHCPAAAAEAEAEAEAWHRICISPARDTSETDLTDMRAPALTDLTAPTPIAPRATGGTGAPSFPDALRMAQIPVTPADMPATVPAT